MKAHEIVGLLEANWEAFQAVSTNRGDSLCTALGTVIDAMPPSPSDQDLEKTVDSICEVLDGSEYGRELLNRKFPSAHERLLPPPGATLSQSEPTIDLSQRLKKFSSRVQESGNQAADNRSGKES
ncbi:hypothetical protein SAMN05519103_02569 [Rhizobiales bacterium GAS113]|nr:hypothetical protein SAMN05519103_02569 [Rhizobiales bacterium GAS113]